ncbi:MAG TPA: 1-acyl-sn-glycerol-3-phosphate acyltransferase [Burkholderiaceae bacterium]|nr:1-acyl-sn-glycerol-3-phosphate acyltransferase [Burkholderiaceae bacterium]
MQLRGSRVARALLRLAGWRVAFAGLPARQGVLIVYPHTSNWDFVVAVLAKWSIGIHVSFWGKASLFDVPLFGRWLRGLGGIPVDRSSPQGAVSAMAQRLRQARERDEFLWLALAPEGTRRFSDGLRSGFYHVAVQAGVPLGLAGLDFARRAVVLEDFLHLCGEPHADVAAIAARLRHHRGRRPEWAAPIRLLE